MSFRDVSFLLVEDDGDHAELIRQGFESAGAAHRLQHAETGEDALARLHRQGRHVDALLPDVVLLDLNLPGISGYEVLRALKDDPELRRIPIVVLTSSSSERDRRLTYEAHANSYIAKPVDLERLREIVLRLESYWGICNLVGGERS